MMSDERRARLEQGAIEAVRRDVDRQMMERADREDQEPMSDERWEVLRKIPLATKSWHWTHDECREIAAEVDRLRGGNAALAAENKELAHGLLTQKSARKSAEARLAEAERHVAALCGELYDMSMVVKLLIPRGCDDIDAERALKQFMQRYPDGPVAPPAAQPHIDPQPPTAEGGDHERE